MSSLLTHNFLFSNQKLKDINVLEGPDPTSLRARIIKKTKWALSTARISLVVLICGVIAFVLTRVYDLKNALIVTGPVQEGLPSWQLPWKFNLNNASALKEETLDPLEMAQDFGVGLLLLPMVHILQLLAIARFYTCMIFPFS